MRKRADLQELIPESHRDLVEAVPRGFPKSAVTGALLFGALVGSLWTYIVPPWLAGAIVAVLVVGHLIYKHRSDKAFDDRMSALQTRGMDWKGGDNS
jgi:amino acid transporter